MKNSFKKNGDMAVRFETVEERLEIIRDLMLRILCDCAEL